MELTAEWTMTLTVEVGAGTRLGKTPEGILTVIPITGGVVEGQGWRGKILPGGADWNTQVFDRWTHFYARYNLVTDDGCLVTVINEGTTPSNLGASVIKTRTTFLVDADSTHAHLLVGIHVGTLDASAIGQGRVTVGVYRLP